MKPGVIYGDDYARLVQTCKDEGYALPAVNIVGTNSLNAVLESAAKNKSDVIIQLSNGGAQFFAGKGMEDSFKAKVLGAVSAAQHVHLLAEHYGVCVVLHTDHADRKLVPWVDALIEEGKKYKDLMGKPLFTSHMLDLSAEPIEENLATSAEFLKKMTPLGMSIEIELGVTGGEEDGVGGDVDSFDNPSLYTQPEDVMQAYDLLNPLGHFTVAASFGNVHGVYKPGNVKLRPEILNASQVLLAEKRDVSDKELNFVFHGGSGSEKAKIEEAVSYGAFKMNIDTDTQFAFAKPIGDFVKENPMAFEVQVHPETGEPFKKKYDPRSWLRKGEEEMVRRLDEAFQDLGSVGKSLAHR
ncbi:class II fructose-bisphosphate aldolase [Temperatibacter marinus]|uniref:Fructose-bisphosphate aldolase n=1 Tax=Temperatibacter marinus TaxID=1456591 RepID=A0AA52H807_9PROT|nr:class II fructose-bisphosphate aldolase [Temperatibacter marinus]WND01626.1 class II fructose-bisphosphate aldolase [Temperatibacter marinus]